MVLKPDAPPPRVVGVRVWPKAIPQVRPEGLATRPHACAQFMLACCLAWLVHPSFLAPIPCSPFTPPLPAPPCPFSFRLQFNVGHLDQLDAARNALAAKGWDGLFLGGNYVSGEHLGEDVCCCCHLTEAHGAQQARGGADGGGGGASSFARGYRCCGVHEGGCGRFIAGEDGHLGQLARTRTAGGLAECAAAAQRAAACLLRSCLLARGPQGLLRAFRALHPSHATHPGVPARCTSYRTSLSCTGPCTAFCTAGVALGKVVEYGYESAGQLAAHLKASQAAAQPAAVSRA